LHIIKLFCSIYMYLMICDEILNADTLYTYAQPLHSVHTIVTTLLSVVLLTGVETRRVLQ